MEIIKKYYTTAAFLKIVFIIVLQMLLLSPSYEQTPNFEWVKSFGTPGRNTSGVSIVVDSNKAIITAGNFHNTVDFDAGASVSNLTTNGGLDVFLTKYDSGGIFIWAKQIGGIWDDNVADIKFDNNGNLFVLGMFQGTVDMDPGPGVMNFTAIFSNNYLIKLDNNGDFIWAKQFSTHDMNTLDIDASNNIIIGGGFTDAQDFDPGPGTYTATTASSVYQDLFILKLDNNGNFIWMRQMPNLGTTQHQQFGVETDAENGIYFAGNFTSAIDFDPGTGVASLISAGSDDAFVVKLDQQGSFQWVKRWGAAGSDKIFGLQVDNDGNVYTTGQFYNLVDFDPGPASYTLSSTARCCFISKLDKLGNFLFAKNLQGGDSFGQAVQLDSDKNIYVSGGFSGTVDFDPGAGIYNLPTGHLFTIKLSANGNFSWVAGYITQTNSAYESVYSAIAVDIFKNVYFTGSFPTKVDFDPGPLTSFVTPIGSWDAYIHKISQCHTITNLSATFCSSYTLNGITYNKTGTYYQVFPLSAHCDSIVALNLTIQTKFTTLSVTACNTYNWNGNIITSTGTYKDTFSLANGCDSIVQLNLTINQTRYTSLNATACGSYSWKGNVLSVSGIYKDTLALLNGCDSIVQLNLIVHPFPKPSLGRDTSLCSGASLVLSPGNFNNYLWNNNSSANSLTIDAPAIYWVKVTDNNNCTATDSITIIPGGTCAECALTSETKLFPSPFKDWISIYKNPTQCHVKMDLYNTLGQLVMKNKLISDGQNKLYLYNLAAGSYYYRLHANGKLLKKGTLLKQ
jgi:uncharacterized protein YegP (UPF0339 family)